jgi:hypothetical protein
MSDPINNLWEDYKLPFSSFDDLTLGRWLAQTLGQLEGGLWRMSHPLVSAYRAAAEIGHERAVWQKRLVTLPNGFPPAECCRSPLLPLFTREVLNSGLICQHCGGTAIEFTDLPRVIREKVEPWAEEYAGIHAVAHYDEIQMRAITNYDEAFEKAATQAEEHLRKAALEILPSCLDYYPALIWEDQDECLEVEPKDITTWAQP